MVQHLTQTAVNIALAFISDFNVNKTNFSQTMQMYSAKVLRTNFVVINVLRQQFPGKDYFYRQKNHVNQIWSKMYFHFRSTNCFSIELHLNL